jgi:formylglycine-generating enzyme required for sulfatase activity
MKILQHVIQYSVISILLTLLLACSGINQPNPPENVKDDMEMVYIPAGEFIMGTSDEQKERLIEDRLWEIWNDYEQPQHTVYLDAFWIDKTEVTNEQYALCVADDACQEPYSVESNARTSYYGNPEFSNYPVIYVDWYGAQAYCSWAGRRLPTEAEWEKAARGTDERTYPWGEGIDNTRANYGGTGCKTCDTVAVGSYPDGASPYGVLDLAGNVAEWVADVYDITYYNNSPSENPTGPSYEGDRGRRGGSWAGIENSLRAAARNGIRPDYVKFPSQGFRCAVDTP